MGFTATAAMTTILALALLTPALQSTRIDAYIQPNFRDASFTAKVLKKDQKELEKINDDFGQGYRFGTTNVRLKEPFKLRIDASVEDTTVTYVINGSHQHFKVPRLHLNQSTDLSKNPGRRQTLMDFGILTPSLFADLFDAKFVRVDRATGDAVFDLTYQARFNDKTRYRIWINPEKKFVTKREWYQRKGRMIATFLYESPITEDGATMPSKLTVKNADDIVAGVTSYVGVRVNQGISDDVFSF
jgi:outer membrane lipoprotein-sorting protein